MKRTLFVVEGQTEQVFVHKFITQLIALKAVRVILEKLHGGEVLVIGQRGHPEDGATHQIQILNVENDEKVNSYIDENLPVIKARGFEAVYGLRDMYTGSAKRPKVDPAIVDIWSSEVALAHGIQVEVTVAIEEVEAWFLSVPKFFLAYCSTLTEERVSAIVGYDLATYDVEKLNHPAQVIHQVLQEVGQKYRKRLDDAHKIAEALDYDDLFLDRSKKFPALGRLTAHLEAALA